MGSAFSAAASRLRFQPTSNMPNCVPQSPRWLSVMTWWPSRRRVRARRVAEDRRADVADVHRLGDVGRAEIHDHGARLRWRAGRRGVRPARRTASVSSQRGGLQAEVEEAGAGDLHLSRSNRHVESGEDVGGQLARVHLPGFGQRHEGVGLVIAELGVGAGPDQDGGDVGVRQNRLHGCLETLFDELVGEHGLGELHELHGYMVTRSRRWRRSLCNHVPV